MNQESTTPTIRFSRLPTLEACPASLFESQGKPSVSGKYADRGTSGHALLDRLVMGHELPSDADPEILDVLRDSGLASSDAVLEKLQQIQEGHWIPEMPILYRLPEDIGGVVTGTADVATYDKEEDGNVAIVDWKFERRSHVDVDDRIQVLGYAAALAQARQAKVAKAATINPDTGRVSETVLDQDRLREIRSRIDRIVLEAREQLTQPVERRKYSVGEHCSYCPGKSTCPAQALVRKEALVLFDPDSGLPDIPRERIPLVYEKMQQVRRASDAFVDLVKDEIKLNGPISDGRRWLGINTKEVTPSKSWTQVREIMIRLGHKELVLQIEAELNNRPKVTQSVIHLGKVKS